MIRAAIFNTRYNLLDRTRRALSNHNRHTCAALVKNYPPDKEKSFSTLSTDHQPYDLSPNSQQESKHLELGSHDQREEKKDEKGSWRRFFTTSTSTKTLTTTLIASSLIVYRSDDNWGGGPPKNKNNIKNVQKAQLYEDLHQAVLIGDERRLEVLLKQSTPEDINARHELGWQLLHLAAANGRARICELLIERGAKINDTDHYSNPRLMYETYAFDPMHVEMIRNAEFNPDLPRFNFFGCTALHYAALANHLPTVEVLIKNGANPTLRNQLGFKAAVLGNTSIAEAIMDYEKEYIQKEKELEEEERRKYPLEKRIKETIVGQDPAISMVAATIRRKQNGWFDNDHPLVFLFLGSSGIGKTELAKQVSKYIHKNNKDGFIRLDMSEYQEQHSVARMIGSPPGYVGYQEGGQLTDALSKCSNAVVLFDEVEKAHPKVLTVLLQLFDEGRMTDGKGKTIECKDAIFIMTSNLASEAIAEHAVQLRNEQQLAREMKLENRLKGIRLDETKEFKFFGSKDPTQEDESNLKADYQEQITISRKFKDTIVRPILKGHFQRDEFLGRINEMVYFLPFSDSELRQLVTKELTYWAQRAKEKNSIELTWDEKVVDVICKGYDIYYGARSIKHEVERRIINQISELHHEAKKAKKVHISVNEQNSEGQDLIKIKLN